MKKIPNLKQDNKKSPWLTFILVILVLTSLWIATNPTLLSTEKVIQEIPISELQDLFLENKIEKIEIHDKRLVATIKGTNEQKFAFKNQSYGIDELNNLRFNYLNLEQNSDKKIDTVINNIDTSATDFFVQILGGILPFVIIIAIIVFMMRQLNKGASNAFSFGKSRAKLFSISSKKTTFNDVAGCKEAKDELEEIVDFLKNPKKYLKIGARIPRGVMLFGAPGTGKTLLARAVAGEASVPFFSISGSEFVEMFVGVGASRVRDLFEKAKKNSPSIIFIDEVDAVGRQRGGSGFSGGHDEREQTLNQILSEMDGFEESTNVIVMAATNRPEVLDKALLRPGRFDRRVVIDKPDIKDRKEILEVHARTKKIAKHADLDKIAKMTPGFAGADLANILNEAAILAAKNNQNSISQKDLEFASEKVMIGPERRSRVITDKEKINTAYHEAGHAIVGHLLPNTDPIRKVTIIPRGMALGLTWSEPQDDGFSSTKVKFEDEICMTLGGYVAEIIIHGEPGTGASQDLRQATEIARGMVTRYGMSKLGPIAFENYQENRFLGTYNTERNFSEKTAEEIDKEISNFIQKALKKTKELLKKNKSILIEVSKELLKKETLDREEFESFFEKKPKQEPKTTKSKSIN